MSPVTVYRSARLKQQRSSRKLVTAAQIRRDLEEPLFAPNATDMWEALRVAIEETLLIQEREFTGQPIITDDAPRLSGCKAHIKRQAR